MGKFCALLTLALALAGAVVVASGSNLDKLCGGRSVEFKSPADFLPIVDSIKNGQGSLICSEGAKQSILELEPILSSGDVCSIDIARRIGLYFEKFVSKKGEFYWKLPKSVKRFFLAVGLKISKLCEESLVSNLARATTERITKEDDEVLRDFNIKANYLSERIMDRDRRLENLFIVTDMSGLIYRGKNASEVFGHTDAIAVNSYVKKLFDDIKRKCVDKFKPIYDELIIPLVILKNIGFDYAAATDEAHQELRDKFYDEQIYRDWFKAVFVCESTLRQRIVANPEAKQTVAILNDEDLAILKDETGVNLKEPAEPTVEIIEPYQVDVPLSVGADLTTDELQMRVKTFSKKRKQAKEGRTKLIRRFIRETVQFIYIDQLKFGWVNSEGLVSYGAKNNLSRKREWIKNAIFMFVGAIGFVIALPISLGLTCAIGGLILALAGAMHLANLQEGQTVVATDCDNVIGSRDDQK